VASNPARIKFVPMTVIGLPLSPGAGMKPVASSMTWIWVGFVSLIIRCVSFSYSTFYSIGLTTPAMKRTDSLAGRRFKARAVSSLQSSGQRWARRLAADVDTVLARHPQADPEDVRLTLICLQLTPLERLNFSLLRGRALAALLRKG
jgi:hypothetical protein